MSKAKLSAKIARWALLIEEFDVIEHRAGSRMKYVDSLSRYPIMISNEDNIVVKMTNAQKNDPELRAIMEVLKEKSYDDYFLRNDVLYKYKDRRKLLVVSQDMQTEIIQIAHSGGAHFSVKRTEENVKQEFYIPMLTKKTEKMIANCIPCILRNKKARKQEGFLNPLNKSDIPLHIYHLDHLGPLESTNKNYNHNLTVIDSFTVYLVVSYQVHDI